MSILSTREDGYGYFYGFREGDHRQINVRREGEDETDPLWKAVNWKAYVGGEVISGWFDTKDQAESAAIKWAKDNPPEND